MSLLKNLSTDDSISNEKDSVGSNGAVDSGLYPSKIAYAYIKVADSGAMGLVTSFKTEDGREVRQTLWMTSGTAKGCKNYYEKDGIKNYLPGFIHANSLALLTVGKELSELDTEQKVINVYSSEAKAEVPTKVDMVMDLVNQDILLGIIKQTVDKTVKNDANVYVPTGETREENELDKVFRAKDRMTTAEIRGKAEEASFADVWLDKWKGKVKNKASGKGAAGSAGAPKGAAGANGAAGTKKPSTSLFA